jgi:hypothetical protein
MIKLTAVILWFLAGTAHGQTWLHVGGLSVHDKSGFNNHNPGLGLEWQTGPRWSAAVGTYRNSNFQQTVYAAAKYQWSITPNLPVNLNIGAATGYLAAPVVPVIAPEICYRWTCGILLPAVRASGASAIAVYLRIPF